MPYITKNASRAPFVADWHSVTRLGTGAQIDWAAIPDTYRLGAVVVTVGTGGAAGGATTVPVTALAAALPQGTTLSFGGAKFARLSAAAASGETSLAVDALPTALVAGDTATYHTGGSKFLPAGTEVGTLAGNGKLRLRVVTTNPAIGLLETNAEEDSANHAASGYGVITGGVIYENLLPGATGSPRTLAAAVKTELNANGTGFAFQQYADSRA